ncbi:SpoIIE family protein phosphatase [Comamonas sp. Y33R10-2]|uniref:SpoIIE family protein phosphatase n=1 Tax=Comamonas sp. Y33R10-2 TaxID=2853257 RepID=UPI001C5CC040|nr:SpoIIE family protein phosphatase [Comamonas sp. Y33R10-2]QXZ09124.1 SpoIIE family protein phosphatase [Comamonas sp. Y33R10-2]
MTLRLRIITIVAAGLLLTTLALLGFGWIREQLQQERIATLAQQAQESLWKQVLAAEEQYMDAALDQLTALPAIASAARSQDSKALEKRLIAENLVPGDGQLLQLLAVLRPGHEPMTLGQTAPIPLLDAGSLEQLFSGEDINGLRLGSGNIAMLISARLVPGNGEPVVLVAGRSLSSALQRFSQNKQANQQNQNRQPSHLQASLLDLRGTLLATTHHELWQAVAPLISPRQQQYFQAPIGSKIYSVTSHQVRDLAGHEVATLVTLKDDSSQILASLFLARLAAGVTLFLIALGLLGLSWYLRRSFEPLDQAISALQALAKGDTSVQLNHQRNDEIGRIAKAVTHFRHSAQELARARSQRERVRRRQEQLIHQQLQQLADATDMTSREEVLQLLQSDPAPQSDDGQLRQLAHVMSDLTRRIAEQHKSLSSMVVELREALVSKTQLAGLQQELQIAAEVQRSILPQQMPADARLQLHCHITPAREVGGDFYDYFWLDKDHLGLVIADVSGKGVPAALFMAITRTLLKSTAAFVMSPSSCIRRLNDLLAAENEQMMFVTIFYGVLHLPSGQLRYVNAGHNAPYLLPAQPGDAEPVRTLARTGGVAVAVSEEFVYQEAVLQLQAGDRLFLFTDGVTEAFNHQQQEYGDQRLLATLNPLAAKQSSPEDITLAVLQSVRAFEDGAPQADDITCVSLLYRG